MTTQTTETTVQVFGPHDAQRPPLGPYIAELWERRRFLVVLSKTRLKAARNNTVAGQLWAILDPVLQAGVYFLLIGILRGGTNSTTSRLVMLIGQVFLFSYTADAMNYGARSVSSGANLLLNARFPRAVLPLSAVYRAWLEMLPSLGIYAVIHVATGRPIGPGIVLLPLMLAIQTVLCLGLALLLSTATVFVKDITNLLGYVILFMLFSAPVIYPTTDLTAGMKRIVIFNPLYSLHASYEAILSGGTPQLSLVLMSLGWAAALFGLGAYFFLSKERLFALEL
ncbi:MAG: teichoic acid transport system permease protein [Acidimicrobiales bacterium]|nr:teichoic acid transport system permease protein [Acidimicrobiales bacterium]